MTLSKVGESFVLGGPQFDAGFYRDRPNSSADIAALCVQVQSMRGVHPVAGIVAISEAFPRYGGFSYGLDVPVETIAITDFSRPLPRGRQLLAGSLASSDVGPVVVDFQTVDPELLDDVWHPLKVTINGDYLDISESSGGVSVEELKRRNAQAQFLIDAFRQGCEAFDPLYGFICGEEPVPTPADLLTREIYSGNVYVSNRLFAAEPDLRAKLDSAYTEGFSASWSNGKYYSSWALLNPAGLSIDSPFRSDTPARQALRRALARRH